MSKEVKDLKKKLFSKSVNGCAEDRVSIPEAEKYCEGYKAFLDKARTERLFVKEAVALAEANGCVEFDPSVNYAPG